MILAICLDNNGGMAFCGRRQSRDRVQRQALLERCRGKQLWMNSVSAALFDGPGEQAAITVAEDFLERCGPGEVCFVEDRDIAPWAEAAEAIIVYRWNRDYPATVRCTVDLTGAPWRLTGRREFPGSSHETITEEVYER